MVLMAARGPQGISVAQVVARRQVRMHLRKIREREYSKLRALIPAVATRDKVTKVQVIEEAVRYIEELHTALLERFRRRHGDMAENKAQETVRTFMSRMMPAAQPTPLAQAHPTHQVMPLTTQASLLSHQACPARDMAMTHHTQPSQARTAHQTSRVGPLTLRPTPNTFEKQRVHPSFVYRKRRKD